MESMIKTPFGNVTYFQNYGFDYIAQYNDKHGVMFGNYTKERINKTPTTSNIVAVFKIKKRKQETPSITYIVYYSDTLVIHSTHQYFGRKIFDLLCDIGLKCLNITHPATKMILSSINTINNTNY